MNADISWLVVIARLFRPDNGVYYTENTAIGKQSSLHRNEATL